MKRSSPILRAPPPPRKIIRAPYLTIHCSLTPSDSLAYASELLSDIFETTDGYRHANEPRPSMLADVLRSAETAKALIEHALAKLQASERQE
ncbi:hypothetical protein G7009_07530 [Pseudomonas capeferrum]|uniref:hypothetical protein n=1 Tax=Pseudomonas capeferrum TaxID=1495066 RepID=UPI0015E3536C|nr:hypothetical protein [Pseudomonas capeferrum]MBA1201612.1 hypothetical protein [Pseudomonas capeferrum]